MIKNLYDRKPYECNFESLKIGSKIRLRSVFDYELIVDGGLHLKPEYKKYSDDNEIVAVTNTMASMCGRVVTISSFAAYSHWHSFAIDECSGFIWNFDDIEEIIKI